MGRKGTLFALFISEPPKMAEAEPRTPMFIDGFERELDEGLRFAMPKDWRSLEIKDFILITDSSKTFISVSPPSVLDKQMAKIEADETLDDTARGNCMEVLASCCKRVRLDNSGRMALPTALCTEVGITQDATIALRGAGARGFRIYSKARFEAHEQARQSAFTPQRMPMTTEAAKKLMGL